MYRSSAIGDFLVEDDVGESGVGATGEDVIELA